MIVIYCHTNRITRMSYVGQTKFSMEKRWKDHVKSAAKCKHYFARAIAKHGPEAFDHVVLETHETQEDANEAENFFIEYLQTLSPNGYNLNTGGDVCKPSDETKAKLSASHKGVGLGRKHSDETRAKIAAAFKGKSLSPETRAKMSASHKGKTFSPEHRAKMSASKVGNTYALGHKHSDETRAKMSTSHMGHKASDESRAKMSLAAKRWRALKRA